MYMCKQLIASGNLFRSISNARETANCSFPGITHTSYKFPEAVSSKRRLKFSLHNVHKVTNSNSNVKKNQQHNFTKMK